MSYAEDMGYDAYSFDDFVADRKKDWKKGYHIDRLGKKHLLSEMKNDHLLNTVNLFTEYDTTPLKEELKKRDLLSTSQE